MTILANEYAWEFGRRIFGTFLISRRGLALRGKLRDFSNSWNRHGERFICTWRGGIRCSLATPLSWSLGSSARRSGWASICSERITSTQLRAIRFRESFDNRLRLRGHAPWGATGTGGSRSHRNSKDGHGRHRTQGLSYRPPPFGYFQTGNLGQISRGL